MNSAETTEQIKISRQEHKTEDSLYRDKTPDELSGVFVVLDVVEKMQNGILLSALCRIAISQVLW